MKKIIFFLFFSLSYLYSQTWVTQTSPTTNDLNSAWAVNDQVAWMCGPNGTVIRTTNGGTTWTLANSGLTGNFYSICAIDANRCFVGDETGVLWRTGNGGATWTSVTLSPTNFINVIHFFDGNTGFLQGDPVGGFWIYYTTTDGGGTWTLGPNRPAATGSEAGWNNSYDAVDTGNIWWGTNVSKIWKGGFKGPYTSYATTGQPNSFGVAFVNASTGVACFQTGTVRNSTNGGITWNAGTYTPPGIPFALKSLKNTSYVFMGTQTTILRSTNNGVSFTAQLTPGAAVYCLTFVNIGGNITGWAGLQGGGIRKYTEVTGIHPINNEIPAEFRLEQNYPNPFNPSTVVKYSVPVQSLVTLKVYNSMGQEIRTVLNDNHAPGNYQATIELDGYASGVYYYTLQAGDFRETRKMILIK
jgi:photosystem II stability/assembly factor-like uncharacterized protein